MTSVFHVHVFHSQQLLFFFINSRGKEHPSMPLERQDQRLWNVIDYQREEATVKMITKRFCYKIIVGHLPELVEYKLFLLAT